MPKKSAELIERDRFICEMVINGHSYREIGNIMSISPQRVGQIFHEGYEEFSDDADRDAQRARTERIIAELHKIFSGPGKRLVSPSGRPVYEPLMDEDGNAVMNGNAFIPDMTKPVFDDYAKTDIANALMKAEERLSKLLALDRLKPREKDDSEEYEQMVSWVHGLADKNRELMARLAKYENPAIETIQAEVISESEE